MTEPVRETADYQLFGLKVRSEIPLPELFTDESDGLPQVTIRNAPVEPNGEDTGLEFDREALVLTIPQVARYRIRNGREILVETEAGAAARNVRLYLLGSAFGALLHQRGLLPLHANAVEIDGRAVVFMGEAGAGKSTLGAWFHDHGFRVIADDVCVVRFDQNGSVLACPGLPRLRLWREALEATGRKASQYPRSYCGDESFDKYDVSITSNAARDPSQMAAMFTLDRGLEFAVDRLNGIEAINAVFDNTYRGTYLDRVDGHRSHWSAAVELVRKVPIYRLARVWGIDRLDDQCELILNSVRNGSLAKSS